MAGLDTIATALHRSVMDHAAHCMSPNMVAPVRCGAFTIGYAATMRVAGLVRAAPPGITPDDPSWTLAAATAHRDSV